MPTSSRIHAYSDLDIELAACAARLIAEDGLDYGSAKRKAAEEVLGPGVRQSLPDNALIESELRRYLQTFDGEAHPRRLAALRSFALELMQKLDVFRPHLVGAVLNGTATEHSNVHLQLFTTSAKDVEMFLLNQGWTFDVLEGDDSPGGAEEVLQLVLPIKNAALTTRKMGVVLAVHDEDAIRVAPRGRSTDPSLHPVEAGGRADQQALAQLIADAAQAPEL